MPEIKKLMDLPPQVWEALWRAECLGGLPFEDVDVKRRRKSGVEVWAWFFGVRETLEQLLSAMRAIGAALGAPVEAGHPYRSDTAPSGQIVCLTVTTRIEDVAVVVKAMFDADEYAGAIAAEQPLTGVAL